MNNPEYVTHDIVILYVPLYYFLCLSDLELPASRMLDWSVQLLPKVCVWCSCLRVFIKVSQVQPISGTGGGCTATPYIPTVAQADKSHSTAVCVALPMTW